MALKRLKNYSYENQISPAVRDLIYLSACAVNETAPDPERVGHMNLDALHQAAVTHQMAGLTAIMLKHAGIKDAKYENYLNRALLLDRIADAEHGKILAALAQAKIWHMPLKGVVIKEYYPEAGMRQMADIDILFDASRAEDVRLIMHSLNYNVIKYNQEHRDDYQKSAACHFELHRMLFSPDSGEKLYRYYQCVQDKLLGEGYEKHLSEEDFYIYVIAHEFKHFYWMGTGLRSLLDTYVILKEFDNKLDWEYVHSEIKRIGLDQLVDFEEKNRTLAVKVFSRGKLAGLSAEEWDMLSFFVDSGMYGTREHEIQYAIKRSGRLGYVLGKLFPPLDGIKKNYPFFYQHKILMPGLFFYRLWKKRDAAMEEFNVLIGRKIKKDEK